MLEARDDAGSTSGIARTRWIWALRLTFGLLLIGLLIMWQGEGVKRALGSVSAVTMMGAVAVYLLSQLLSAAKWRLLLNSALVARELHGSPHEASIQNTTPPLLSLGECYRFYLIGMFWNLWMPTAIGGDAMRAILAGRRCNDFALAASAIFMERLTGLLALIAIGAVASIQYASWVFDISSSDPGTGWIHSSGLFVLAVTLCVALLLVIWGARNIAYRLEARDAKSKWTSRWANLHRALDLYATRQTRGALLSALAMSFLFHALHIALNIFLANAVGLQLPALIFCWLVPGLAIASMLPLGIGGLGVREAAATALLLNLPHEIGQAAPGQIIAWSLLWQATVWLSALPGAWAHWTKHES